MTTNQVAINTSAIGSSMLATSDFESSHLGLRFWVAYSRTMHVCAVQQCIVRIMAVVHRVDETYNTLVGCHLVEPEDTDVPRQVH